MWDDSAARNQRLERALANAGLTRDQLADACEVSPKTAERWITQGRVPWPRLQFRAAEVVGVPARELWPESSSDDELVAFYPHRASVPAETWLALLNGALDHVDVLAWAATFFHQIQPRTAHLLTAAARRGARVRLCFGEPTAAEVAAREIEEPLLGPGVLANKIRVSLGYYRELLDVDGIEVRLHRAVVYASLFRYDDEIVVNPHVLSRPASENPALHLRKGTTFDAYVASFETVWDVATPWKGEPV